MLNAQYSIVKCSMLNVKWSKSSVECPLPNSKCPVHIAQWFIFNADCLIHHVQWPKDCMLFGFEDGGIFISWFETSPLHILSILYGLLKAVSPLFSYTIYLYPVYWVFQLVFHKINAWRLLFFQLTGGVHCL